MAQLPATVSQFCNMNADFCFPAYRRGSFGTAFRATPSPCSTSISRTSSAGKHPVPSSGRPTTLIITTFTDRIIFLFNYSLLFVNRNNYFILFYEYLLIHTDNNTAKF